MYTPVQFPKHKFHKTKGSKVVHTEQQEKDLGDGWVDHPDKLPEDEPEKPAVPPASSGSLSADEASGNTPSTGLESLLSPNADEASGNTPSSGLESSTIAAEETSGGKHRKGK